MFYPDAPPIWRALPERGNETIATVLSRSIARFYSDSVASQRFTKAASSEVFFLSCSRLQSAAVSAA